MRTWDIIDKVDPGVEITATESNPPRFKGSVSSAVRVALSVAFVVGTAGLFSFVGADSAAKLKTRVEVLSFQKPRSSFVEHSRTHLSALPTDTQFGQSTVKLSKSFTSYFQPAPDEESYEDDYFFG